MLLASPFHSFSIEAYSFLRQPFGLDDRAPSDALHAAEISPKELLDAAFGNVRSTWLKGFRCDAQSGKGVEKGWKVGKISM